MKIFFTVILSIIFFQPSTKTTLWLCGDSTMSVKKEDAYPETGWGMPFTYFWDSTIEVKNLAKNGRSTKTFILERLWDEAYQNMKPNDVVFIQFGHNDESIEKKDRYTTPIEFKNNLKYFISAAHAKNAIPILLTPVSRRKFSKDGKALPTHTVYSALVMEVAKETNTYLIDLDELSRAYYEKMGEENSKLLFLHLQPLEHPNYPDGKIDNTHFNELGARIIAQLVLQELRKLPLAINQHILKK